MGGSHETPFKMKGSGHYGLGNSSPAKDRREAKGDNQAVYHNTDVGELKHGLKHGKTKADLEAEAAKPGSKPRDTDTKEEE